MTVAYFKHLVSQLTIFVWCLRLKIALIEILDRDLLFLGLQSIQSTVLNDLTMSYSTVSVFRVAWLIFPHSSWENKFIVLTLQLWIFIIAIMLTFFFLLIQFIYFSYLLISRLFNVRHLKASNFKAFAFIHSIVFISYCWWSSFSWFMID